MKESEISKQVQHKLDNWKAKGVVFTHMRLNSGTIQIGRRWVKLCDAGTPDRVAYVNREGICWVYFIEVKTDTGVQSYEQHEFQHIFKDISNVVYEVVRTAKQVDITIESITGYNQDILDNIQM